MNTRCFLAASSVAAGSGSVYALLANLLWFAGLLSVIAVGWNVVRGRLRPSALIGVLIVALAVPLAKWIITLIR